MMKMIIKRAAVGLVCMAALLALTLAVSAADTEDKEGPVRTDCLECHEDTVTHWQESDHGQATVNAAFVDAWEASGSPGECMSCHSTNFDPETGSWEEEGIACSVCHYGQTGPHPETAMPTDQSTRLCGTCHTDTQHEYEISEHNGNSMVCVRCHNPHTTDLREGSMEDLCIDCHNEEGHYYNFTAHAQEGLSCNDCHLRVKESDLGEGHARRQHTFNVDLATCTECHGTSMHFPAMDSEGETQAMMWTAFAEDPDDAEGSSESDLIDEPNALTGQPLNYLLVAVVGMGFGIAITPWAETQYRKVTAKRRGSSDGKEQ